MTLDVRPCHQERLQSLGPTPMPPKDFKGRTEALNLCAYLAAIEAT